VNCCVAPAAIDGLAGITVIDCSVTVSAVEPATLPNVALIVAEASTERISASFHNERNHQGKSNALLFPNPTVATRSNGAIKCRKRLGGLLRHHARAARVF
jgi:hypothetical protein